ncbi:Uncharacterised protein [Lysinibacillus capsici]|uniref:Uncharacterized protein n=1 Tax=Lysinibacillus capsici TaxID=2115968 RepID=A0A2X1BG07_9BACI|nr:hypothetical protein [Lysinibacillus capsici]SPU40671.1 Uncharacterised protein [Lysinibacillus capsici]
MLLGFFAFSLIVLGIYTLAVTGVAAFGTLVLYSWDERATQGTIILIAITMTMLVLGFLY